MTLKDAVITAIGFIFILAIGIAMSAAAVAGGMPNAPVLFIGIVLAAIGIAGVINCSLNFAHAAIARDVHEYE